MKAHTYIPLQKREKSNPARVLGKDTETGTYYLRARYYDPTIGRFTQQGTHWNTANMIYGDHRQKINEREDTLGLKAYSYVPQITAIMQSRNQYVYALSNPCFSDSTGNFAITAATLLSRLHYYFWHCWWYDWWKYC